MKLKKSWLVILALFLPALALAKNPLVVQTRYGKIKGTIFKSELWGETITTYAWLGVPYAQPPSGELRWKAPRPPKSWKGIKSAQSFPPPCPQYGGLMATMECEKIGKLIGRENCLYLNIWRPASKEKNLPVYFWIHGGGNFVGQSNMSLYYGANFAYREKMVFVSINYRLGPLGWFYHPALKTGHPLDDSGNYGILDIIQALKWVKENIARFGGDPNNITIAGESAGGVNVYSLLVSPLAKGLFQKAVAESGTPRAVPLEKAEKHSKKIIATLLQKDGLLYKESELEDFLAQKGNGWLGSYLRSKSIEELFSCYKPSYFGSIKVPTSFIDGTVITQLPLKSLKKGEYNKVPFLVGANKEELKLFLPLVFSKLDENGLCQLIKSVNPDNPQVKIKDQVSPWNYYNPFYWIGYALAGRLGGVRFEKVGVDLPAKAMSKHQDQIYVYRFCWKNEPKPFDFLIGAGHAVEIPFVFANFQRDEMGALRFAWSKDNQPERIKLSQMMMSYWGNFARTGNPNASGLPTWEPWSKSKPERIKFGKK